jgi:predicted nucleic acid-binding Zn ribbon protein
MKPIKDDDERCFRQDAQRKTLRIPPPKKISDALSNLMARKGYGRVLSAGALGDAWQTAAGERLAGHSLPGAVKRGVLEVLVRSSAVLQELTFAKHKIVKQLKELCPHENIRDVKFKVGQIGNEESKRA